MKAAVKLLLPMAACFCLAATLPAWASAAVPRAAQADQGAASQAASAPATAEISSGELPPCPAAAPAPAARKWKGNGTPNSPREEYDAYVRASQAANKADQAQLYLAFAKAFPQSDYLLPALSAAMSAEAQSNDLSGAVKLAERILHTPSADADSQANAYAVMAYLLPQQIGELPPNSPQLGSMLNQLDWAAQCGQRALAAAKPPAGETEAVFAQKKAQAAYVYDRAAGFVALQRKNYPAAISNLTSAVGFNPKDTSAYYWLGIAELSLKPNPNYVDGIFYIARANSLSPGTAVISQYLNRVYSDYHGSADGLPAVEQAAAGNARPPAGFTIESAVQINAAARQAAIQANEEQLEKAKSVLYPEDTFRGIMQRLVNPETRDTEWKKVKGQGYEFQGILISATSRSADVSVDPFDKQTKTPDVHVVFTAPHRGLQPGDMVAIEGVATDVTYSPFMLTLSKGTVKPAAGQ